MRPCARHVCQAGTKGGEGSRGLMLAPDQALRAAGGGERAHLGWGCSRLSAPPCLAEVQAPCGTTSGAGGPVGLDGSPSPVPASALSPS